MGDLLTAVKTRAIVPDDEPADIVPEQRKKTETPNTALKFTTPDEALEALRSKPDKWQLCKILQFLEQGDQSFNIKLPGPKAALLINVLVNTIVPDYWASLDGESNSRENGKLPDDGWLRNVLVACLRSVAGVGAVLAQLRSLITASRDGVDKMANLGLSLRLKSLLEVLRDILEPTHFLTKIWSDLTTPALTPVQEMLLWKELTSILASGKIPSLSAEASDILGAKSDRIEEEFWVASTQKYSTWLACNIVDMASMTAVEDEGRWKWLARLLGDSYSLGYTGMPTLFKGCSLTQDGYRVYYRNHLFQNASRRGRLLVAATGFAKSLTHLPAENFLVQSSPYNAKECHD